MSLIHSYIYNPIRTPQPAATREGFFYRHKIVLGIILALTIHISFWSWSFYRGVIAPFTQMAFIDEAYNEVKWIELSKKITPLKYPSQLLPHPGGVVPLKQLDQVTEKQAEKKARDLATKKKPLKEELADQTDTPDETVSNEGETPETASTPEVVTPKAPQFGLINARPIRDIVGKVYTIYQKGELGVENIVFSLTLGFEVKQDGSLSNIQIIKSSGSPPLDAAALNIAAAISESHALMPLAALSATAATLDINNEKASIKISGLAATTTAATDLSNTFNQQLAGLRLLMSFKNKEAAELLAHMAISHEENLLIANLSMSRTEASAIMRKNFENFVPKTDKLPETFNQRPDSDAPLQTEDFSR
jgi:hypothetical protein